MTVYRVLRASDTETAQDGDGWTFDAASGTQVPTDVTSGTVGSGSSNLTVVSGSVTLDDGVDVGTLVGYRATASTTFTGQGGSVALAAGVYIFERVTGGWTYRTIDEGTGLTPPAPDTTAPTAGTLAVTDVTHEAATLTVTGASDNQALHGAPYAFSINNGSTWTGWQASNVYAASGLTPSTSYTFRHKVRDASGNEATGTAVTQSTTAAPPAQPGDVIGSDDFTGDGALVGRTSTGTLGGPALVWSGSGNAATSGGTLVGGSTGGYAVLPVQARADMEASFTIKALPTAGSIAIGVRNQASNHRYVLNILPNSARIQRFGPSGGTIVGSTTTLGAATVGTTATIKIVGSTITATIVNNTGTISTLSGTDSDVTAAGTVGVDMGAGTDAQIDDLVVTAR